MIIEYHRPEQLDDALQLLARADPPTRPLGGGTVLGAPSTEEYAVVDLQSLGLNTFTKRGNFFDLGATLNLQALLDHADCPAELKRVIQHEATYNLRQAATVAGTLVSGSGRSPFTTALLALDARLRLLPGEQTVDLGDLLPIRTDLLARRLITEVTIPANARLAYEYVARSPADLPVVCAAIAQWPSGRTRLALGGFGAAPKLAFDGSESEGLVTAANSAFTGAGDAWATAEYRSAAAGILAERCLERLQTTED